MELPWTSDTDLACHEAHSMIVAERSLRTTISSYLNRIDPEGIARITDLSSEKSTHYKWYLGGDRNYQVWLHQYRNPAEYANATAHAASIHNHRYPFCSRVVQGRLVTKSFAETPVGAVESTGESMVNVGDTMRLSAADVHQITAVLESTMTLVVQGPPLRNFSTVWSADGTLLKHVFDLDHLYICLKRSFVI